MRLSRRRATGSDAHPASCPWVTPTNRPAPRRRSAGASRPSGAAAPNTTESQPSARSTSPARRRTPGSGSISDPGCRTTGNGCAASNSAAPFQSGAYTTTEPGGRRSARPCTKAWIPPGRGGKSLVTNRVLVIARPEYGRGPPPAAAGAMETAGAAETGGAMETGADAGVPGGNGEGPAPRRRCRALGRRSRASALGLRALAALDRLLLALLGLTVGGRLDGDVVDRPRAVEPRAQVPERALGGGDALRVLLGRRRPGLLLGEQDVHLLVARRLVPLGEPALGRHDDDTALHAVRDGFGVLALQPEADPLGDDVRQDRADEDRHAEEPRRGEQRDVEPLGEDVVRAGETQQAVERHRRHADRRADRGVARPVVDVVLPLVAGHPLLDERP